MTSQFITYFTGNGWVDRCFFIWWVIFAAFTATLSEGSGVFCLQRAYAIPTRWCEFSASWSYYALDCMSILPENPQVEYVRLQMSFSFLQGSRAGLSQCLHSDVPEDLEFITVVTPCGDTDSGQILLRYWLSAWQHQAITWVIVNTSLVRYCSIYMRAISQDIFKISVINMSLEITNSSLQLHLPII